MPSSPVPSLVDIPAVPDGAGPKHIDPTTSSKIGSIIYDQEENSYNLEWESRADWQA